MVDELTNESFQTGKAIVTVSVDLIQAIAEACRRSEEAHPGMSDEQKDSLLKKLTEKVTSHYKETHGSLKAFNKEGADITHLDVSDERTAEILKDACKKSHIPMDMQKVPRSDGTVAYTAFIKVESIDQVSALLKMSSERVLEEQKAMTKTLTLYNEKDEAVFTKNFVKDSDIDFDSLDKPLGESVRFDITNHKNESLDKGSIDSGTKDRLKDKAKEMNPKQLRSLSERIKDKQKIVKKRQEQKDKNRERDKTKKKDRNQSL